MVRYLFLLSFVLFFSISCETDDDGNVVSMTAEEQAALDNPQGYIDGLTDAPADDCSGDCDEHIGEVVGVIAGIVKDSSTKVNIAGAEVSLSGRTAVTFTAGAFAFNSLTIGSPVLINFSHPNFITSSSEVLIKYGTANFLEKFLTPVGMKQVFGESDNITLVDSAAIIKMYDLMTADGTFSSGDITAALSYLSVSTKDEVDAFPGNFEGKNSSGQLVPLIVNGFVSISATSASNEKLEFAQDAEVTFPANSNVEGDPSSLPTWFFDSKQGEWIEDGVAYRQSDGSYKAFLPKTGNWCIGQPMDQEMASLESGIIMGHDGPYAKRDYIRIHARGKGWRSKQAYTDSDGIFTLSIYPNNDYSLKATATFEEYTDDGTVFTGQYSAETIEDLKALEPGEVNDDRQ